MDDRNAYGAIRYQDGFGLNPLKLAWGYQKLARQAGASLMTRDQKEWIETEK